MLLAHSRVIKFVLIIANNVMYAPQIFEKSAYVCIILYYGHALHILVNIDQNQKIN